MLHQPCILRDPQTKADKIRIGCLNPAFWGPKSGRKCYITPAFLGVPNKGDKIKVGPKGGANATSPLHSRGSPTKGTNQSGRRTLGKIRNTMGNLLFFVFFVPFVL